MHIYRNPVSTFDYHGNEITVWTAALPVRILFWLIRTVVRVAGPALIIAGTAWLVIR